MNSAKPPKTNNHFCLFVNSDSVEMNFGRFFQTFPISIAAAWNSTHPNKIYKLWRMLNSIKEVSSSNKQEKSGNAGKIFNENIFINFLLLKLGRWMDGVFHWELIKNPKQFRNAWTNLVKSWKYFNLISLNSTEMPQCVGFNCLFDL